VSAAGAPSVRSVLLRGWDGDGFRFFTNLRSRKAGELDANPRCGLLLFWHRPLLRQIGVTGTAGALDRAAVEAYWASRPRPNQLGSWASPQSSVLRDRAALERLVEEAEARFAGVEVPLPDWWGGYLVRPETVELWQGQDHRLHDRLRWALTADGWRRERLAP
jgi:pyridoxamine 5'-phosphate oxidase